MPADGTPADISGNHNDALLPTVGSGIAQYVPGQVGQAFHCDGASTYVDFNYGSGTDWFTFESFTMGMWVKDNSTAGQPPPDGVVLADHHSNFFFAPIWTIFYSTAGSAYQYQSGDIATALSFTLTPGAWHYLAITRDGTSRVTTIYVDGTAVAQATGTGDINYVAAAGMRFGADFNLSQYWAGDLDEMRFYDRALSGSEVTALGASTVLPAITTVSFTGPTAGDAHGYFTASTQAGVAVRIQSTTTPDTESSWTDIPGATMTEFTAGSYAVATTTLPRVNGEYFRCVSTLSGYTDGKSDNHAMGPFDLAVGLQFSASGPSSPGNSIQFAATAAPGLTVHVQSTADTSTESSWNDLLDGNSGHMIEDTNNPGSYSLNTAAYSPGVGISFRAVASQTGQTDVKSAPLGPFTLHQAVLSISAALSSTSDWTHGYTAYVGDYLIYKLTFKNTGDVAAKSLQVTTPVPTFLHSDQPVTVKTVAGSTAVTLTVGDATMLNPGGSFLGSNNLISGITTIASITDATHLVLSAPATATGTGPSTVVFGAASYQFTAADISIGSNGTYVPETAANAKNAKVVWDVGDLTEAGDSQYVTFVVHLSGKVRADQAIGLPNNYAVFSTLSVPQPGIGTTGFLSHATNVGCNINGSASFTMVPQSTTVTPGGYMTYVFTLTNRSASPMVKPVGVVVVPDSTRFAATYPSGAKGVSFVGAGTLTFKEVYVIGSAPQVVLSFPPLAAHGVVKVSVTFQAQWADPAYVTKISTVNYGAAFLDLLTPKPISAVTQFTTLFNAAGITAATATATNFFSLISDPANKIAHSLNQSGIVDVTLSGSLDGQPELFLFKQVSNGPANTDDDGNGGLIDTVRPGDKVTFIVGLSNGGTAEADEVYVEDGIPDHTTYVANSAALIGKSASTTLSKLVTVRDPDGHHLRFMGLHLGTRDNVSLTYTVLVDNTLTAPAPTDPPLLLPVGACTIGSGSTPHTPPGLVLSPDLKVVGVAIFPKPSAIPMIPPPIASSNINATITALNTLYGKTPSAAPLTNAKDLLSYIPGVERYYIHYENIGTAGASGVTISFPIPAHTTFYRASWMTLTASSSPGSKGNPPGVIAKAPTGATISTATPGSVTFLIPTLPAPGKGDVMVEVIVNPDAVQVGGSSIGVTGTQEVTISDSTVNTNTTASIQDVAFTKVTDTSHTLGSSGSHQARARLTIVPVADLLHVPKVGIQNFVSHQNVQPGEQFTVMLTVCNWGDVGCHPLVEYHIPSNATFISADAGQSLVMLPAGPGPGNVLVVALASNNGPIHQDDTTPLLPHTAASVTITLQATGADGTDIVDGTSGVRVDYLGLVKAIPSVTHIVIPHGLLPVSVAPFVGVNGVSYTTLNNGIVLIDLLGGNVVATGASNLVASGGGNLVASGGGNLVATGGGNLIAVQLPGGSGFTGTAGLLANQSFALISSKFGNLVVQNATALVASGGGNLVAAGGGNLVASGGGNLVASGGGNLVASGGGNLVASGGGNLMTTGGGNVIASTNAALISNDGGGIISSVPGASLTIMAANGQLIASGGGN